MDTRRGAVCKRSRRDSGALELLPAVDAELRRCVALVPNEVNVSYSCWPTWDEKNLLSFLARAYRPTIVAQWARPMTRARRKPQAIAKCLDGTLVTLRPGAVARSRITTFDDRGLSCAGSQIPSAGCGLDGRA